MLHRFINLFSNYSRRGGVGVVLLVSLLGAAMAQGATTRVIVKWKASTSAQRLQTERTLDTQIQRDSGASLKHLRQIDDRLDVLGLSKSLSGAELDDALTRIRQQQNVEYAVADERRFAHHVPNDPRFVATTGATGQWYLRSTTTDANYISAINAEAAWDIANVMSNSANVVVAVVDTGVRFDHADLQGKLLSGYDFVSCDNVDCSASGVTYLTANDGNGWDNDASDPGDWVSSSDISSHSNLFGNCDESDSSWHGTRVAGIIAAAADNGTGIAGTGWNTRILPVRALGKCGGYDSDIIAAMKWAAGITVSGATTNSTPAQVINLSIGGSGSCSSAYTDAISQIRARGVSIVASAGNDSGAVNAPANCSGVIGVAALRNTGTKVGYSSLGTQVSISAPGGNCGTTATCAYSIDTTTNSGSTSPVSDASGGSTYTNQSNYNLGTSFSAPIVSGTLALMYGLNPNLTPDTARTYLRNTASAFPTTATSTCSSNINTENECNCTTSTCGAGMLNAYAAVQAVANDLASSSSSQSSSSTSSSSSSASSSSSSFSSSSSSTSPSSSSSSSSGGGGGGGGFSWALVLALAAMLALRLRHTLSREH